MSFLNKLEQIWEAHNSLVCVGLDTDPGLLPKSIRSLPNAVLAFNKAIIDATYDLVCAYKPQIAFYAALGLEPELEKTIDYIHENYPTVPVILDSKRGDIGSTATLYAREAFERYKADAVTVNPYLGTDSLTPFLAHKDRGVIVLCRTSNASAREFQDQVSDGKKLYQHIAHAATTKWNANDNVLLVVGATYPEELREIRKIVGDMPLLVPGIGAQGGDIEAAVTAGQDSNGAGMIINSSRGIIYASAEDDFAEAARASTLELRDAINSFRKGQ